MSIRNHEVVVHRDDCAAVDAELASFGYHRVTGGGSFFIFAGGVDGLPASHLLERVRNRHGHWLRVGLRRRMAPARIIRGAYNPHPTLSKSAPMFDGVPSGLKIGVIDTGVVVRNGDPHAFLRGRISYDDLHDVDEVGVNSPAHSDGHGSFVAGVILREAPPATVLMRGVIDRSTGRWEDEAVADAIRDLVRADVALINMSFSGDPLERQAPDPIVDALKELGPNVVVVAAAGNAGNDHAVYPAAVDLGQDHPMVIAVGAVDNGNWTTDSETPRIACFSGTGEWVTAYADGIDVLGPYYDAERRELLGLDPDGWATWSGTSFACATVTGKIAAAMTDHRDARTAAEQVLEAAMQNPVGEGDGAKPYVQ